MWIVTHKELNKLYKTGMRVNAILRIFLLQIKTITLQKGIGAYNISVKKANNSIIVETI